MSSVYSQICLNTIAFISLTCLRFLQREWLVSHSTLVQSTFVQLKCGIYPSSTVALHPCPIKRTQTCFAANAQKFISHVTFLHCFHPLHGFHKNGRAFWWFLICFPGVTAPLFPFKALLSLSSLVRNNAFFCSNNPSTFFTPVYNLWFGNSFMVRVIGVFHLRFQDSFMIRVIGCFHLHMLVGYFLLNNLCRNLYFTNYPRLGWLVLSVLTRENEFENWVMRSVL